MYPETRRGPGDQPVLMKRRGITDGQNVAGHDLVGVIGSRMNISWSVDTPEVVEVETTTKRLGHEVGSAV